MRLAMGITLGALMLAAAGRHLTPGVTAVWEQVTQARPEIICDIWHHCDLWPEAWKPAGQVSSEHPMPDPTLTPGAVLDTDPRVVFAAGYDRSHRVWRHKAYTCRKYGVHLADCHNFEDDDLCPVCAGGDNANELNHWTQPCSEWRDEDDVPECVAGDAADKDRLERSECDKARRVYWQYERGRASLEQATKALADVQAFFVTGAWKEAMK